MAAAIAAADHGRRRRVALDLFACRVETERPADAGGDVRQVHDRRGPVPRHDVRVGLLLATANAVEEVLMVRVQVRPTGPLGDELVAWPVEPPADRVADDHHAAGAIERGAVAVAVFGVRRPDPLFEDQLPLPPVGLARGRIFEYGVLRVWNVEDGKALVQFETPVAETPAAETTETEQASVAQP